MFGNDIWLFSLVGIPGLEPRMTGPESVVLPLHHIPISYGVFAVILLQNYIFFLNEQKLSVFFCFFCVGKCVLGVVSFLKNNK